MNKDKRRKKAAQKASIAKLTKKHHESGRTTTMDAMIDTTIRQQLSHLDPRIDPMEAILTGMNGGIHTSASMSALGGMGMGMGMGMGSVASMPAAVAVAAAPSMAATSQTSGSSKEAGYERVHVVKVDTWGLDLGHRRKEMGLVPTISPLPKRHRPAPFMQALVKSADDRAGGKKGTGPFSEYAKEISPKKQKKRPSPVKGGLKHQPGQINGAEALLDLVPLR